MQRIDQLIPTSTFGDAVSNNALTLMKLLREWGFKSDIYAENIGLKVTTQVKHINAFTQSPNQIIMYHMSTGSDLAYLIKGLEGIQMGMIYHNITPAHYFSPYNSEMETMLKKGRAELLMLKDSFDFCLADSSYNCDELIEIGFQKPQVLPIIVSFDDYTQSPDSRIFEKYRDGKTNIIFVGRIAPNKKQEDIIKAFYYYKTYIDKESRLFLIGSFDGMEKYFNQLKGLVKVLGLSDVYFTGHLPFAEILAYYNVADVFLCMSEHEGFCVPLLESMYFKVPILAYKAAAIPETLGKSGVLFHKKDYKLIAETIGEIVNNTDLRQQIVREQELRLKDFAPDKISAHFNEIILNQLNHISK